MSPKEAMKRTLVSDAMRISTCKAPSSRKNPEQGNNKFRTLNIVSLINIRRINNHPN